MLILLKFKGVSTRGNRGRVPSDIRPGANAVFFCSCVCCKDVDEVGIGCMCRVGTDATGARVIEGCAVLL